MKIGIVTYWRSIDNYGEKLQCYALQTFLKGLGHEVFLIKDTPAKTNMKRRITHFLLHFSIKKISVLFHLLYYKWRNRRVNKLDKLYPRNFKSFMSQYISSTRKEYTIDILRNDPPAADIYICGSDQIWNGASPVYFLDFGYNVKRMSYAASFGQANIDDENYRNQISTWLKYFDIITVREHSGVNICRKAGRDDAICVPDPTLLLLKTDYMQIVQPFDTQNKAYLFLYLLGSSISIDIKSIYVFAKKEGLEVIYVASQGRFDKYPKVYPTVGQWIFLINNAKYIVTNSYHGIIFSMLMNKPFLALPLRGKYSGMNDRLSTLFNDYKLPDCLYSSSVNSIKNGINYVDVNEMLTEKRTWIKNQMKIWIEDK
jgi:hypothetical protein